MVADLKTKKCDEVAYYINTGIDITETRRIEEIFFKK
jgi:hypothetical protein